MIIITGLPRSGTSLLMQCLEAGGLPVFADAHGRVAQHGNARGSYEHAAVFSGDHDWVAEAQGMAVKVPYPWLGSLPVMGGVPVLVVIRNAHEVAASRGCTVADAQEQMAGLLEQLSGWDWTAIRYRRLVEAPVETLAELCREAKLTLDPYTMAKAVDPSLWHHRV